MNKYVFYLFLCFLAFVVSGCNSDSPVLADLPPSRFELVEKIDSRRFTQENGILLQRICIIRDRETGVLYFASDHHLGGYQIHTPVLDENGRPMIIKDSKVSSN